MLHPTGHTALGTHHTAGCKGPTTELATKAETDLPQFSSYLVYSLAITVTAIHSSVLDMSEKIQYPNSHRIKLHYNFNYLPGVETAGTMDKRTDANRIDA
jgi:hypothetical protein